MKLKFPESLNIILMKCFKKPHKKVKYSGMRTPEYTISVSCYGKCLMSTFEKQKLAKTFVIPLLFWDPEHTLSSCSVTGGSFFFFNWSRSIFEHFLDEFHWWHKSLRLQYITLFIHTVSPASWFHLQHLLMKTDQMCCMLPNQNIQKSPSTPNARS